MTNEEKVQYWIQLSDYDMETAEAMLQSKRYLYVKFMYHPAMGKILKAGFTKLKEETPPFVHKLTLLARRTGFYEMLSDEQKAFVIKLDPLNINARYPDYKNKLSQQLTCPVCTGILIENKHNENN
ncbi:MAG: HEPN domain-containing protein [Prevotellaceae bacterium]|jgi:HEPN domain-containing protein|nr:HEPN domain-containing protein [Prevotellaceae bacterium]